MLEYKNEQITSEDQKILLQFKTELDDMNTFRTEYEKEWAISEKQFDAELQSEWVQKANIRLQLTRNIIEQQLWEEWVNIPIQIKPEWKNADSYMLDTAKYTMDYFIRKEEILDEIVDFKMSRAIVWTWILFSWIWETVCTNSTPNWEWDIYNKSFKTISKPKYHIWVKNIPIWDIWLDDTATKPSDIKRAIRRERMDIEEFRKRYKGKKWFNYIESVRPESQDNENPETTNKDVDQQIWNPRNVYLFHYFNEITWDYRIVANRTIPIYVWKSIFRDSKIPFDVCQMYKNPKSIYWKGTWYKTRSHEAYMNTLFELMLDKVYITSNPPLILWNNWEVDWEIYSWGSDIAILNFNWDVKQVQQMQMDNRIDTHKFAMDMSKDETIQNTWINPWEYNKPLSWINPFVAWLQEQSKKAKLLLCQIQFDSTLSKSFTKMLNNLMTYWPTLYGEKIEKIIDWKVLKDIKYLDIQIKWKEIKEDKIKKDKWYFTKNISYSDNPWNYWYFEFNDTVFMNEDLEIPELSVYVETPSTKTLLESIKKQEYQDLLNNLVTFTQLYPWQELPVSMQELYEMQSEIYWYDVDEIQMRSETDKIRKETWDLLDTLDKLNPAKLEDTVNTSLQPNQTPNAEQNPTQTMTWASQPWQNQVLPR